MAKRYHQNARDRFDERLGEEFYANLDSRRAQEYRDSQIIHEDRNAFANLPQHAIIREWPRGGYYMLEGLDDTIKGINDQMDEDGKQMLRGLKPQKY